MTALRVSRTSLAALALYACMVCSGTIAASLPDEKQAAELLDEGLMLAEWSKNRPWCVDGVSNGNRARNTFDQILKEFPATRAAAVAEYARLDSLLCLGRLDDVVAEGRRIVSEHPGTVAAAWAQLRVGEALARAGESESRDAIRELRSVAALLPGRLDLRPLNESRTVLGSFCEEFLAHRPDVLDAVEFLGLDKTDPKATAETLAIVAAYRGRKGKSADAVVVLDRLERECPAEQDEINWAKCRVAIDYLRCHGCRGDFASTALQWLRGIPSRTGDDLSAEACLWQARYYCVNGPASQAVPLLEDGKERYLATAHGAEILYALGCALDRSGKHAEAIAAMRNVSALKPDEPFHSSMAEFYLAKRPVLVGSDSVVSAIRASEAAYSSASRFLAYRPADTMLSPHWFIAAQVVSLIKEGLNEEALRIVSALPTSASLSPPELLRARGEVLLCSMRCAADLGRLYDAQPDTVLPLVLPKLSASDREGLKVRYDLLDAALSALTTADDSRCPATARLRWLTMLAHANIQSGRRAAGIKLYTQALAIPGMSRDSQASTEYQIAMCYWDMKQVRSACSVMQRVSEHYSDTKWGQQARRTLNGWRIVERLREEKGK